MDSRRTLLEYQDSESLAGAAAKQWLGPGARQYRSVALSGGRIARYFLRAAAEMSRAEPDVFQRLMQTHFFWADERCVPPEDAESNYRLARESLFDRVQLPALHLHRLQGELEPSAAVQLANAELLRTVPVNTAGTPMLDLVILGMGEDGHVASLFPDGISSRAQSPYAVAVGSKPPNPRLTLTYSTLAAARECWVLIAGGNKEAALQNSLTGNVATPLYQLIQLRPHTTLFVDRNILNSTP